MGFKKEGYFRLEGEHTESKARQGGNLVSEECKSGKMIQNKLFIRAKRDRISAI